MIIFLAIMIGAGVLFGTGALVVDLGYGMAQQTVMQTSADAGAMAAAKVLATSVGAVSPEVLYVATDRQVDDAAKQFAEYNRSGGNASSSYATAVEYLGWNGSECVPFSPTRRITVGSAPGLVPGAAPLPSAVADPDEMGNIPPDTCAVRVFARVTYAGLLAAVPPISASTASAMATGTAQVLPAQMGKLSGLWPVTRWIGDSTKPFEPGDPPVTFWDSNPKNWKNGDWKLVLDLSRYSALADAAEILPRRSQLIVDYDHNHPGNTTEKADLEYWLQHGWSGEVHAEDSRCSSLNSSDPVSWNLDNCTNSRLEIYPHGDGGANVATPMQTYIDTNSEGVDASDQDLGDYATVQVFLWRYGEIDINLGTNLGSRLYTGLTPEDKNDGGKIQRVIIDQVKCFRFYTGTVSGSDASGYYVSCLGDTPSGNGPPSALANVVKLIN